MSGIDTVGSAGGALPDADLRRRLRLVSAITVASGATQLVAPAFLLRRISTAESPMARQLFGTIGMFMVVVGGNLWQSLVEDGEPDANVVLWSGVQKVAAAAAVGLGVRRGLFKRRALLVASFDFASGIMCFAYRRQLVRQAPSVESVAR